MNETKANNKPGDESSRATPTGPPGGKKMRAINVMVPASVYLHARVSAAKLDIPLKTFVAKAIENTGPFAQGIFDE